MSDEIKYFDNAFRDAVDDDVRSMIRTEIMMALVNESLGISHQEKIAELIMERLLEREDAKLSSVIEYAKRLRGDVVVPDWRISMFKFLSELAEGGLVSKEIKTIIKVIMSACDSMLKETNDKELIEMLDEIKDRIKI